MVALEHLAILLGLHCKMSFGLFFLSFFFPSFFFPFSHLFFQFKYFPYVLESFQGGYLYVLKKSLVMKIAGFLGWFCPLILSAF